MFRQGCLTGVNVLAVMKTGGDRASSKFSEEHGPAECHRRCRGKANCNLGYLWVTDS